MVAMLSLIRAATYSLPQNDSTLSATLQQCYHLISDIITAKKNLQNFSFSPLTMLSRSQEKRLASENSFPATPKVFKWQNSYRPNMTFVGGYKKPSNS